MSSSTTSSSSSNEAIEHVASWTPHDTHSHIFVQILRKYRTMTKRPNLFSTNTWPRSPTNVHSDRPELTSSNSNTSELSHNHRSAFQQHRRTNTSDADAPSVPFRNPRRISDIQDSRISSAFTTTICCRCFRYITLRPYHYECSDEYCREVVCNDCIEIHSQKDAKSSYSLKTIFRNIEFNETWKRMTFLEQFEATGKALDGVCRLYPVKIVQRRR